MAQRRMFSPKIVSSDAFLDMPTSSRELYFQLGMYADDDGFVNPRFVMRIVGAGEDDIKILISKRFVLPFENGVVVIKHWKINNLVRKDFYKETIYLEQKSQLITKENGGYTESVNNPLTIRSRRLGKVRLGKVREEDTTALTFKTIESNLLWEQVKEKYPFRDYEYQFNLMLDWWSANKKKLPKNISAFTNWLQNTKEDPDIRNKFVMDRERAKTLAERDTKNTVHTETLDKLRDQLKSKFKM